MVKEKLFFAPFTAPFFSKSKGGGQILTRKLPVQLWKFKKPLTEILFILQSWTSPMHERGWGLCEDKQ